MRAKLKADRAQAVDGKSSSSEMKTATPRGPRTYRLPPLKDVRRCTRYIATVIRGMHNGDIGIERGKALVLATRALARIYQEQEFEAQLVRLEASARVLLGNGSGGALPAPGAPRLVQGELVDRND
jgi:hypothetical protein